MKDHYLGMILNFDKTKENTVRKINEIVSRLKVTQLNHSSG